MKAEFTFVGVFCVQVCVPKEWTDAQVIEFAQLNHPCGTSGGWSIRKEGDPALGGEAERVICTKDYSNVHIMLDA